MLNPDGAWLVMKMLGSCGSDSCDEIVTRLRITKVPTALRSFSDPQTKRWLKPVFDSLQAFAVKEDCHSLGTREVAQYFGGVHHIQGMIYKAARSNLGMIMGLDAGLVLDVLLPLDEAGHYRNGDWDLDLGEQVWVNPDDQGVPCAHRGLVVKLGLEPEDVASILTAQRQSVEFAEAIGRLGNRVTFPPEYLEALRLTCT